MTTERNDQDAADWAEHDMSLRARSKTALRGAAAAEHGRTALERAGVGRPSTRTEHRGVRSNVESFPMKSRTRFVLKGAAQQAMLALAARRNLVVARTPKGSASLSYARFMTAKWVVSVDSVRAGTLELAARQLAMQKVPGAVAELGVFQGDFSRLLQLNLPDRELHLFDTFAGFDDRDKSAERQLGLASEDFDFRATSPNAVAGNLPRPNRAHFHVGWFPESAQGLAEDQTFCLVSLDADLYEPLIAGLSFFYPRLSPGGFIFVHDVNNPEFPGAAIAATEFLEAEPTATATPLPDAGGSLIIVKSRGAQDR